MMKNVFLLAFTLCVAFTNAQSNTDYETMIDSIKVSYNAQDKDGLTKLFSEDLIASIQKNAETAFTAEDVKESIAMEQQHTGKMLETEYIMDDEQGKSFLVQYKHTTKLMYLALDDKNKIAALRVEDY